MTRGEIVDGDAIVTALRTGHLGGAALDVAPIEPLPADHPLWTFDNVIVTPHIAGPDVPEELAAAFNANLARYIAGRPLRHVVDRRRGY